MSASGPLLIRLSDTQSTALVRVAVETKNPGHMPELRRGLRLLNQADPCVHVVVAESGELHLVALGELHLERCLKDLAERFARVPISASAPIANFQETIVASVDPAKKAAALAKRAKRARDNKAASGGGGGGGGGGSGSASDRHGSGSGRGSGMGPSGPGMSAASAGFNHSTTVMGTDLAVAGAGVESTLNACVQQDPVTGIVKAESANRQVCLTLRALPLPAAVTKLLADNEDLLRRAAALHDHAKRSATARSRGNVFAYPSHAVNGGSGSGAATADTSVDASVDATDTGSGASGGAGAGAGASTGAGASPDEAPAMRRSRSASTDHNSRSQAFMSQLATAFAEAGDQWSDCLQRVWFVALLSLCCCVVVVGIVVLVVCCCGAVSDGESLSGPTVCVGAGALVPSSVAPTS